MVAIQIVMSRLAFIVKEVANPNQTHVMRFVVMVMSLMNLTVTMVIMTMVTVVLLIAMLKLVMIAMVEIQILLTHAMKSVVMDTIWD
jgi:hypothetical protein